LVFRCCWLHSQLFQIHKTSSYYSTHSQQQQINDQLTSSNETKFEPPFKFAMMLSSRSSASSPSSSSTESVFTVLKG
jgi:hypothetical protein